MFYSTDILLLEEVWEPLGLAHQRSCAFSCSHAQMVAARLETADILRSIQTTQLCQKF